MEKLVQCCAVSTRREMLKALIEAGVATAAVGAWPATYAASVYPAKPINLIVPNPPGGNTDIVARIFSSPLGQALGKPIVVDNRAGAGGSIGTAAAARAASDGYTWVVGDLSSLCVAPLAVPNVAYDVRKSFDPVGAMASVSIVISARPDLPATSFREFLAQAKKNPGKFKCGTAGNGTMGHLCLELLKYMAGIEVLHVPYRGGAPAVNDLLGGQIDIVIDGTALAQVKAGRLKALAVTAGRLATLPGVPTVAESGVPGFSFGNYWGILMPAGSPREAITRANSELMKLSQNTDIRKQLENAGFTPMVSTPDQYGESLRNSFYEITTIVKRAHITFN